VIGKLGSVKLVRIMYIRRIPDTQEFPTNVDGLMWNPFDGNVLLVVLGSPGIMVSIL